MQNQVSNQTGQVQSDPVFLFPHPVKPDRPLLKHEQTESDRQAAIAAGRKVVFGVNK